MNKLAKHDCFGEVINIYSRMQALEDGTLIDVLTVAREAGFTISVAVTYTLWHDFIEWTKTNLSRYRWTLMGCAFYATFCYQKKC
jgi:uncharacterized protein DUF6573